jgi:4-amino-4-deoxy-L-arabinose transferase-like glycosyltransferase
MEVGVSAMSSGGRGLGPRGPLRRWTTWPSGLALVLLCLALYLPGLFSIPAIDRDESRFAQASRQMLDGDSLADWMVPKVQDRPRLNKPPLIYWLQATSAAIFTGRGDLPAAERDEIWMYRIPSLLGATVAVLFTWRLGILMFHPGVAWLGAALLAACPVLVWESKQARSDMVLLAFTTATMYYLYRLYRDGPKPGGTTGAKLGITLGFWLTMAAAILTKGPIAPLVAALTVLTVAIVKRRCPQSRWWFGIPLVLALVGAWVYGVASQIGFSEYARIVFDETLGRSMESKENHGGPPGYHFIAMHLVFVPAVIGAGIGVWRIWCRGVVKGGLANWAGFRWFWDRFRAARFPEVFLIAWVVPSWIVFELIATKLPHYPLPLYPALALLAARGVAALAPGLRVPIVFRFAAGIATLVLTLLLGATAFGAVVVLGRSSGTQSGWIVAGAIGLVIVMAVAMRLGRDLWRRRYLGLAIGGVLTMIVISSLLGITLSGLQEIRTSRDIARAIAALPDWRTRPIGMVKYHEDSLIFESHGHAQRIPDGEANAWFAAKPRGIIIVQEEALGEVPAFRKTEIVEGYNYSKGMKVRVHIGETQDPGENPGQQVRP